MVSFDCEFKDGYAPFQSKVKTYAKEEEKRKQKNDERTIELTDL